MDFLGLFDALRPCRCRHNRVLAAEAHLQKPCSALRLPRLWHLRRAAPLIRKIHVYATVFDFTVQFQQLVIAAIQAFYRVFRVIVGVDALACQIAVQYFRIHADATARSVQKIGRVRSICRSYPSTKPVLIISLVIVLAVPFVLPAPAQSKRDQNSGLTQANFAQRFVIPLRTLESWLGGTNACPPYTRLMLAKLCGL